MASNYPPGVTGNEYEIAGPDSSQEWEEYPCPACGEGLYMVPLAEPSEREVIEKDA